MCLTVFNDRYPVRLLAADGRSLQLQGGSASHGPDAVQLTQTFKTGAGAQAVGDPAKLTWEFPIEVEQVPAVFEFSDVPLP